jgi:hypothetical protein
MRICNHHDILGKTQRLAIAILAIGALGFSAISMAPFPTHELSLAATQRFIANLNIARYEQQGTDYTNPAHSPLRLGKSLEQLDTTYDYDYAFLEQTEEQLEGVDRPTALRAIFARATEGATSPTQVHVRLLAFLHRALHHNLIQPTHRNGAAVYDPLVLLELGEGRCGHVNRVAVDLFLAAGYPARLVQAAHHVLAEVYYADSWHYFDGDIFGNGETVFKADGTIPSLAELSRMPQALDGLTAFWEPDFQNHIVLDAPYYPAYFYFARAGYTTEPLFYMKAQRLAEAQQYPEFGWNCIAIVPDHDRRLYDALPLHCAPGAPLLDYLDAHCDGAACHLRLAWRPSRDPDGDLAGYRVYVSRRSRGWGYNGMSTSSPLAAYKSHPEGWKSAYYTARYTLPPGDVATVTTDEPAVDLTLANDGHYYISIMPIGAHGSAAGRTLFPVSEEIVVQPEAFVDDLNWTTE